MKQLPPDTPEQSLITQYKGPRLVVKAYAGTGKTTTLVKYAHNNLDSRILYLAYNRAIGELHATTRNAAVTAATTGKMRMGFSLLYFC